MNRTQPIDYKSVLSLFLPAGLLDYFGSYNIVVFLTICISYANNCFTL